MVCDWCGSEDKEELSEYNGDKICAGCVISEIEHLRNLITK